MTSTQQELRKLWDLVAEDLYLLARLHAHETDRVALELLRKGDFPSSLALPIDSKNSSRELTPLMKKAIDEVLSDAVSADTLSADYAAIYLNVAYEASPNESAWIDEENLERQEPMFEVRNWYSKYGLETENWRVRQDDNLSLQLLFIAHLLKLKEPKLRDLGHFMDFHILRWVDLFADRVFQRADTAFYASLCLLTARYVDLLRDFIAEADNRPRLSKEEVEAATKKSDKKFEFDPIYYSSHQGGW